MFWIALPFQVATVIDVFTVVMPVSTIATMTLALAAGIDVPRPRHVERLEVPLARRVAGVVRRHGLVAQEVRLGVGDFRLRGELLGEDARVGLRGVAQDRDLAHPFEIAGGRTAAERVERALLRARASCRP